MLKPAIDGHRAKKTVKDQQALSRIIPPKRDLEEMATRIEKTKARMAKITRTAKMPRRRKMERVGTEPTRRQQKIPKMERIRTEIAKKRPQTSSAQTRIANVKRP